MPYEGHARSRYYGHAMVDRFTVTEAPDSKYIGVWTLFKRYNMQEHLLLKARPPNARSRGQDDVALTAEAGWAGLPEGVCRWVNGNDFLTEALIRSRLIKRVGSLKIPGGTGYILYRLIPPSEGGFDVRSDDDWKDAEPRR